jgi:hypothetical protein
MTKKGPVIKNTNKNNRHGTNCNDDKRVVVGRSPGDPIYYSVTVQKSVEHYIMQYDLKCSLVDFPMRVNWAVLLSENKVSNEFINAFHTRVNWSSVCRFQKLSEDIMNKHAHVLDWDMVSYYQKISKKFIAKHVDDLNIDVIVNKRFLITQEEIDDILKKKKEKEDFLSGGEEIEDRFDILDM